MLFCIYKITNLKNGKIYVGQHQTTDVNDDYMGSGTLIKRAIKRYGVSSFSKEIIRICSSFEEMNNLEREIVNEDFIKREDTYNINLGGGACYDAKLNPDSSVEQSRRNKIRETNRIKFPKGGPRTTRESAAKGAATRSRLMACGELQPSWVGRSHSETSKQKMRETRKEKPHQIGEGNSQFGTMWITHPEHGNKKVRKDEPLPDGWTKGRKMS